MKNLWMMATLALVSLAFVCEGQEMRSRRSNQRSDRGPSVRAMSEADTKAWLAVQEKLRKADAKEFAEVEKLAATNLAAAFNKMQLMAAKAKISTPSARPRRMMGSMRGGDNRRMGMGSRRGGMMGRPGMGMGMMGNPNARNEAERSIQEKFPAEFAAYEKKVEENRNYLKDLAKKAKVTLPADFSDLAYLRKKYADQLKDLDFRASMEKLRSLAEQEGYSMGGQSSGRLGRGSDARGGDPAEALPPPPPKRDFSRNQLARKVREKFPAEWKEYLALRQKDKAAAEKKLEELLKRVK